MWDKSASSVGYSLHTGSKFMNFSIFSTKVCEKFISQEEIRGLSQKFVDNMDNFVQSHGKGILRLPLFCQLY